MATNFGGMQVSSKYFILKIPLGDGRVAVTKVRHIGGVSWIKSS
jgi:hypothetical protein